MVLATQKIVGIFGEYVVCNWLSRSGFEASVIDHTRMDLIAYDPTTRRRLGITVKSRTRDSGKETASVNIFKDKHQDREKLKFR
jgi:Holliday junction resolvase-like predicted endonuclease